MQGREAEGRGTDPENLVGVTIGGRYLVRRCISQGGMGVIYLAQQEALNRDVIVKVVRSDRTDSEGEARFRREARSLSLLSHPNIVQIFDHGHDEPTGLWYIVMEYVRGVTLTTYRRRRGGTLPLDEFLPVARMLLEGVAEAHIHGLVHRDLKPSNVMLTSPDGLRLGVKVVDFGLSKLAQGDPEQLTRTNYFAGSPMYLAPELFRGKGTDARADVYAIGVIFFQLLTGSNPLQGDDPYQLMMQQITTGARPIESALPPDHTVPLALRRLVDDCLSVAPEQRPQDAGIVLGRLLDALSDVTPNPLPAAAAAVAAREYPGPESGTMQGPLVRATQPSRVRTVSPPRRRTPVAVWAALGAVSVVILLMSATLAVLLALLVSNFEFTASPTPPPDPPTLPDAERVASESAELLRQRALMAIREGDYDRAVSLTTEAMAVAPQDAHLGELLDIVTDLRDRHAPRTDAAAVAPAPDAAPEPRSAEPEPERPSRVAREPQPAPQASRRPPAPAVGTAVITSAPAGLGFEIPGVAQGTTPFQLDVPVGTYQVTLLGRDGRAARTEALTVTAGNVALLDLQLDAVVEPPVAAPGPDAEPAPVPAPIPAVPRSGPTALYVYVPGGAKPRAVQDALAGGLSGIEVTAFGSFRELQAALASAPPTAVIAPGSVLDALGLQAQLQGLDASGSPTARYVLLGTKRLTAEELGGAVIGTVDVAGRESSAEFVAKLLNTPNVPQVRRVAEQTDLLPLLQFGTADAVLLPEANAQGLLASTQLALVRTEVASGAGLPAVAVLDGSRQSQIEGAVQRLGGDANAKVGVQRWGRP